MNNNLDRNHTINNILEAGQIESIDANIYNEIKKHWDRLSKPLDSMGRFETLISRIGAIQNTINPRLEKVCTVVFAADNGIVEEGVSQAGQDITAICTDAIAQMKKSVSVMASLNGIDVKVVDVGVSCPLHSERVINRKIRNGSRNFAKEAAMTREETLEALVIGFEMAEILKNKGYDLICVGEMGIGNTTTSSAVIASLLNVPACEVVGPGAGLSSEGIARKVHVVEQAVSRYSLTDVDPLKVLECVGGYDIAAMVGLMIGGGYYKIPVIIDGFISAAAALVAEKLVKGTTAYLVPSHCSAESAALRVLRSIGLEPVIFADMSLGEGTGAVMMVPLLRTAIEVYRKCSSFDDDGIEAYEHLN